MRAMLALVCLVGLVACGTAATPPATATPDRRAALTQQLDEYAAWERAPGTMPREAFLAQRPLLQGYVLYWQARYLRAHNGFYSATFAANYAVATLRDDAAGIADYLAGR